MDQELQTFVFYANEELTGQAIAAGASGIVVDWEYGDKERRQNLYDTQINRHGEEELMAARALTDSHILCRINGGETLSQEEVDRAISLGADELLVPMVTSVAQIERVLGWVQGQVGVALMIETEEAVTLAEELGQLPISKVYVGLNDLSIARKSRNLFMPMVDGTVDAIRPHFKVPFGIAGLTHPALGKPIPSLLLLREMQRLQCSFTFLRRSFFRDMATAPADEILQAIGREWANRGYDVDQARQDFIQQVQSQQVRLL